MKDLKIFNNEEFGEIRTITKDNEPWFIANDVCKCLEIGNTSQALARLDDDERNTIILNEGIGNPNKSIVNEYGLYNLILASRKKEAKKFKRWITHEVLPAIRKDGGYISVNKGDTEDDILARAMIIANKRIESLKLESKKKDQIIGEQKPKVLFANTVATSKDSVLVGGLAKILKQNGVDIGANRLFEWLRQEGFLCKSKGENWNAPTQRSMEQGLFEIKVRTINNPDGSTKITRTPKVTGKGQIYFVNKFLG